MNDIKEAIAIQQIIPPATMIPACGLLILSASARMNTVLARIRTFHSERLDAWKLDAPPGSRDAAVRNLRLKGLEHQTHRLLQRALFLRATMLLLFVSIMCNAVSVIALAGSLIIPESSSALRVAASAVFLLGIVMILAAMATSILEVVRMTETVRYEHRRIETICAGEAAAQDESLTTHSLDEHERL